MTTETKHAPATPLPWIVNQRKHVCAAASGFADVATTADGRKAQVAVDDAAYIAHAANAYPKLVEALRAFVDGFKSDPGTSDLDNEQPVWSGVELGEWRKADYLLRSLGELS